MKTELKIFRKLRKEYDREIYFLCFTLLGDPQKARNITECIFDELFSDPVEHVNISKFEEILYKRTSKKCRAACEREASPDLEDCDQSLLFPFQLSDDSAETEAVYRRILSQPFSVKAIIFYSFYAKLSSSEIADIEGVSEENILEILHTAEQIADRQTLRAALKWAKRNILLTLPLEKKKYYKTQNMIAIAVVAGVLGIALVGTGSYTIAKFNKERKTDLIIMASSIVTPTKVKKTPKPAPTATPLPTQQPTHVPQEGERPVPARLVYSDEKFLTYQFKEDTVTARDSKNNLVLEIKYSASGKILSEKRYPVRNGLALGNGVHRVYDEAGKILSENDLSDQKGTVSSRRNYEYNNDGQLVKITEKNGSIAAVTVIEYNKNGTLRRKFQKNEYDISSSQYECVYDEEGKLLKEESYSGKKLLSRYEYEYDSEGVLTKSTSITFPASANCYVNGYSKYDRTGKVTESFTEYMGAGISNYITKYIYDENGEIMLNNCTEYREDGATNCEFRLYDCDITISEKISYKNNIPESPGTAITKSGKPVHVASPYTDYLYDHSGNLVQAITFYKNGERSGITYYEYDAEERLVKMKEYSCYTGGRNLSKEYRYEYDENGILCKITNILHEKYLYDKSGRLVQFHCSGYKINFAYNTAGTLEHKTISFDRNGTSGELVYEYNTAGEAILKTCSVNDRIWSFDGASKKVKEALCNFDGSVKSVKSYEYNTLGLLTKITESNIDGALLSQEVLEYDAYQIKTCSTKTVYDVNGMILSKEQQYFGAGEDESLLDKEGMVYDQKGNLINWSGTDRNAAQFHFEFVWINEQNPAYSLYALSDPADLIP